MEWPRERVGGMDLGRASGTTPETYLQAIGTVVETWPFPGKVRVALRLVARWTRPRAMSVDAARRNLSSLVAASAMAPAGAVREDVAGLCITFLEDLVESP